MDTVLDIITFDGIVYTFNKDNFHFITENVNKENNLAIITVIGDRQSGKSTFLNFIIDYLSMDNHSNWPSNRVLQYQYFCTDESEEKTKPSIQMFSRPFEIKTDDDKTITILLMDAHLVFDLNEGENKLMRDVLALFLEVSSTITLLSFKSDERKFQDYFFEFISQKEESISKSEKFDEYFQIVFDCDEQECRLNGRYLDEPEMSRFDQYFERVQGCELPNSHLSKRTDIIRFNKLNNKFNKKLSELFSKRFLNSSFISTKTIQEQFIQINALTEQFKNVMNNLNISLTNLPKELSVSNQPITQKENEKQPCSSGYQSDASDLSSIHFHNLNLSDNQSGTNKKPPPPLPLNDQFNKPNSSKTINQNWPVSTELSMLSQSTPLPPPPQSITPPPPPPFRPICTEVNSTEFMNMSFAPPPPPPLPLIFDMNDRFKSSCSGPPPPPPPPIPDILLNINFSKNEYKTNCEIPEKINTTASEKKEKFAPALKFEDELLMRLNSRKRVNSKTDSEEKKSESDLKKTLYGRRKAIDGKQSTKLDWIENLSKKIPVESLDTSDSSPASDNFSD